MKGCFDGCYAAFRPVTNSPLIATQRAGSYRPFELSGKQFGRHPGACLGRRATVVKPVCASPIQQLQQIFSLGSPAKSASKEIQALIQEGSEDVERFGQLVDVLLDSELPFKEASLGGGEWQSKLQSTYLRKSRVPVRASLPAFVPSATAGSFAEHLPAYMLSFHGCISAGSLPAEAVVYTRGALLWQQLTSPGQLKSTGRLSYKSKRKAGQDFSPSGRLVKNRGELLGSQVVVTAKGTYEPQDNETNLPKLVKASISGGEIVAWGKRIPLPISGTGFFSVMFVDDTVRVLSDQKKGTVSVQIQADRLRQMVA